MNRKRQTLDNYDRLSLSRKKEVRNRVRVERELCDWRVIRRKLRRRLRTGSDPFNGLTAPEKPGKFVSRMYRSSGAYKSAYSYLRSELDFYDLASYADY